MATTPNFAPRNTPDPPNALTAGAEVVDVACSPCYITEAARLILDSVIIGRAAFGGKPMTRKLDGGKRQAWTTPMLRRIEAGSAEAIKGSGIPDGGSVKSADKS